MTETNTIEKAAKKRRHVVTHRSDLTQGVHVTINPGRVESVLVTGSAPAVVRHRTIDKGIPDTLLDTLAVIGQLPIKASMNYMRMLTHAISGQKFGSLIVEDQCYIVDTNVLNSFKPGTLHDMRLIDIKPTPRGKTKNALQNEIMAELAKQGWINAASIKTAHANLVVMLEHQNVYAEHELVHPGQAVTPLEELMAYADETSAKIDGWEGELIGAGEIKKRHKISAGSLKHYREKNRVIAFTHGATKFRYPAEQFWRTGIVPGIHSVREIIKIQDEAWLWLTQPCPYLDGMRPIDELKSARINEVVDAAHKQYDL